MESNHYVGSDDICIALIGPTGAGKTSTINSIIAQLVRPKFEEPRAIAIDQPFRVNNFRGQPSIINLGCNVIPFLNCQSNNMSTRLTESQTSVSHAYTVQFDNLTIKLIDAPGITDTSGKKQEKVNADEWVRGLNKVGSFNIIALVVKSSENRIDFATRRMVANLQTMLPDKYKNNVVVFFTHVVNRTAISGSEIMRALDVPIRNEFYFENSCILSPDQFASNLYLSEDELEEISTELPRFWSMNKSSVKRLLQVAREMVPQTVIPINELRCQVSELKFIMAEICQMALSLMLALQELKKLSEEQSLSIKSLKEIEEELITVQSKYNKYNKSNSNNENQSSFVNFLEKGNQAFGIAPSILEKLGFSMLQETLTVVGVIALPIKLILKGITYLLKHKKKTLMEKMEHQREILRNLVEKQTEQKSTSKSVANKIEAMNALQQEIISKVKVNCRTAIYLHIKSNSSQMKGNATKAYFLEQLEKYAKKILKNKEIGESFKQASLTMIRYLKEAFDDYETNYDRVGIDSFLDAAMKQEIDQRVKENASKNYCDRQDFRNSTLFLRKPCPLI
jgi:predicted GTPase